MNQVDISEVGNPTYQSMTQIDENIVEIAALNLKGGMSSVKIITINSTTNQVVLLLWH
jgi:hypothetical protein